MVREEVVRNDQSRIVFKGEQRFAGGLDVARKEGVKDNYEGFGLCNWVVPFTNTRRNQEEQILVRIRRSEHVLKILNCQLMSIGNYSYA